MFRSSWPLWVIGLAGCVMYVLVHVEARYVAAFLVLFWCAIVCSLPVPRGLSSKWATVIAGVAIAALLLPLGRLIYPPA